MIALTNKFNCWLLIFLLFLSCRETTSQPQKDLCDNPDAEINCCFVNMPSTLTTVMKVAKPNEAGEKLIITGTIFKSDGITPYPGVILYAYHTDNTGHYTKKGNETGFQKWHGYLHGWCKTDINGKYEIHSIRPARYPDNTMPAHIHSAVKTPNSKQPFYINDFVFQDDSLVNQSYLSTLTLTGGTGVVNVQKNTSGIWIGTRNITIK